MNEQENRNDIKYMKFYIFALSTLPWKFLQHQQESVDAVFSRDQRPQPSLRSSPRNKTWASAKKKKKNRYTHI